MPFLLMLSIVVQVYCAIHVVRSGHDRYWVFLILLFPGMGCLIYFIMAILPDLLNHHRTGKLIHRVKDKARPNRHLDRLKDELYISETSQNYLAVAEELVRMNNHAEAIGYFQKALTGIFSHDPDIMIKLAQSQYAVGQYERCRQTIETLRQHNPRVESQDIHLLYALALQAAGDAQSADREFAALCDYFTGPQARFHYFEFLSRQQRMAEAKEQLAIIAQLEKRAKPHYKKLHKHWLDKARKELRALS